MATLPEKSFQGQPLLEKKIIKSKKSKLSWAKNSCCHPVIWRKKTLCLNVKFESNHQLIKNINYISKPKKNCQNAASRFCDYIIISRGCSSHFLDIWIRTNPLLSAEKKTCRKPSFSNFLLLLVESPCIFFWLETQSYIWLSHVTDLNQKSCSTTGFVDPFSTTSK